MATLNVGMKVNRAISGATTVSANATVIAHYVVSAASGVINMQGASTWSMIPVTRIFGPGQSVPASYTTPVVYVLNGSTALSQSGSVTYSLVSGVELINTI